MIARSFQRSLVYQLKLIPINQFTNLGVFNKYRFCTSQQDGKKQEFEEKSRYILNELKDKDNQGTGSMRFSREKNFQSYVIYEHHMDQKEIKLKIRLRLLSSSIWFGAGVLVFHYVHPLAAFIPLIIMSRSIMSYKMGSNYTKKLINKVQLSEDKTSVKLYALSGDIYECSIDEMDFQGINDLSDAKQNDSKLKEDQNSELSKLKQSSFLAMFDTTDKQGNYLKDLKILFNDQLVNMENAELLTKILRGDKDAVLTFQYVNEYDNSSDEISDEKLEEQLQEEIRKRKK
ncbi:hypothetical protein ABPG72_018030 [Tetrahymena utriculariae]